MSGRPHLAAQILVIAIALVILSTGCSPGSGGNDGTDVVSTIAPVQDLTTEEPLVYGIVQGADQASDGTKLIVSKAELHGVSGFIVVHAESQGGPGDIVGHAPVPEGVSTDVVVPFDRPEPSAPYWAMLHRDGGVAGVFEWPGPDGPVRTPVGPRYAMKRIAVAVGQ